MLEALVVPTLLSQRVSLHPPDPSPKKREAMVRRVLGLAPRPAPKGSSERKQRGGALPVNAVSSPAAIVAILGRCLGELRYGAVRAVESRDERVERAEEERRDGDVEELVRWEADLVLEACELAVRTLERSMKRVGARAVLDWLGEEGGDPSKGAGGEGAGREGAGREGAGREGAGREGAGREGEMGEGGAEMVGQLMALCEVRGWLVSRRRGR